MTRIPLFRHSGSYFVEDVDVGVDAGCGPMTHTDMSSLIKEYNTNENYVVLSNKLTEWFADNNVSVLGWHVYSLTEYIRFASVRDAALFKLTW